MNTRQRQRKLHKRRSHTAQSKARKQRIKSIERYIETVLPDMTKEQLIDFAAHCDPPIEILSSWRKSKMIDTIAEGLRARQ